MGKTRDAVVSVRFNVGGSGSFVSSTGLVLTNHHVASDTLFKLSNSERDIAKDGYLANGHADRTEGSGPGTERSDMQSKTSLTGS